MICPEYFFNPDKDLKPVEQTGYIDLVSAYDTGTVPSNLEGSDEDYNGMDAPDMVLGKPGDIFEAYRMREYIDNYSKGERDGSEVSKDSANG